MIYNYNTGNEVCSGAKQQKHKRCCSLIDKFMWGNLYHSNVTLVARNNTSRWMDGLIFRTDPQ